MQISTLDKGTPAKPGDKRGPAPGVGQCLGLVGESGPSHGQGLDMWLEGGRGVRLHLALGSVQDLGLVKVTMRRSREEGQSSGPG